MDNIGIIIEGIGGLYTVLTDDGNRIYCKARGSFRHDGEKPYIGDKVALSEGNEFISDILPRKNALIRPPVSNVDNMFIVIACINPEPVLLNVDKLTCICEHNSIRPSVIITKSELSEEKAKSIFDVYTKVGYKTFITDEKGNGDNEIREYIKNECRNGISCFAGASGVGKSTLMTRLFPSLCLETGEISEKILRGKHTTRKVNLYPLGELFGDGNGGYIADTPGFSMIDFINFDFMSLENLPNVFPEFEQYIGKCRYTKCSHLCEEGCAVCGALSDGDICKSRHENYVLMYNDLKSKNSYGKNKGSKR